MNNLLEKVIKRNNKKRGINITIATLVIFLLNCILGYAATEINGNEKENVLHVGTGGENSYIWGSKGTSNQIDGNKLIINGKLDINGSHALEISSDAKDITVENNGMINGVTVGGDFNKLEGTDAIFTNNGIVTKGGNAVIIYSKNSTVNNYGIIKGGEKGVEFADGVEETVLNNQGIIIDKDGKILKAGVGEQKVTLVDGTYIIKNAIDNTGTKAQVITMEGSNSFDKYILNGLDTTVSVSGTGNTISNSVINSLGNAISIESTAEIGLTSTTINGDIIINGGTLTLVDTENKFNGKILGTTNNDSIKLGYKVDENTNYTNLNILLKDSEVDNLKFSDKGNTIDTTKISFRGKYIGGIGEDIFKISADKINEIKIDGGDGSDTLTLAGAYIGNFKFSSVTNVETLQLGSGNNELNIESLNFSTIKGGTDGSNKFITTKDITKNLTLVGGGNDTLYLNNSSNTINFDGKLEGNSWTVEINNLKDENKITLNKENLNDNVEALKIDTAVSGEAETTNLVELLNSSGITYAYLVNGGNNSDNLVFKTTNLANKSTFAVNQYDNVTMQGNIDGEYSFRTLGTFTPTVKVDSTTVFGENSKVTSVNSNGVESGVNFKVTSGVLNLGLLKYENDKLVYEGNNPFVNGYKYIVDGDINLSFSGLENAKLEVGTSLVLGSVNNNISIVNGSVTIPSFLKYSNGVFIVKSWSEMNPYGDKNNFLEGTYNNMLANYKDEAIKNALNNWSKEALVNYITTGGTTQYEFVLDGKTYQNILLTGDNSNISKEFNITGTDGGSITFKDIATSNGLILNLTGSNQANVLLDENVNIGGDINFGESTNVSLTINARGISSTVKNILGNGNDSNIKLTHVQIIGDNSNGKIDLGGGVDSLTLNNVGVSSIIGSGKNIIELNQGSNVGTISLMDLDMDSSINNNITVNDGATVDKIDLSKTGNSSVTLNSGKINSVIFGAGNDMLTYNGGVISSIDFGTGDNVLNVRADLDLTNTKVFVAENGTIRNILNVGKLSSRSTINDNVIIDGDFSSFSEINIQGTTKLNSNLVLSNGTLVNFNGNIVIAGLKTINGVTTTVLDGAEVNGNNGKLLLDTSLVGVNANISLGGINGVDSLAEIESSFAGYSLIKGSDGNYVVEINKSLITGEESDVIQAIIEADGLANELGTMSYEEQIKTFKDIENDMKYSTPYVYSNIVSRKTAEMVNNMVMNFDLKADKEQWLAYGSVLGGGKEMKDYYSGVNSSSSNIDTDIQGAYVQAEYGYTENTSLGFVVAGNKTDSDMGKSTLKGNGAYLGTYFKHNHRENFQIIGGVGYQNNSYESERVVGNSLREFRHSKDYSDNTITGFIGGKYKHKISENLVLEPNTKLSITHVRQDGISENKNEILNMELEKKNFTTVSGETGVDLVKKITNKKGNVKLKVGTNLVYMLNGTDDKKISGTLGSSNFDIDIPNQDKTNIKFKVGAQYEKNNGIIYNVEGSYLTSSNENEWIVGAGIAYKF